MITAKVTVALKVGSHHLKLVFEEFKFIAEKCRSWPMHLWQNKSFRCMIKMNQILSHQLKGMRINKIKY